MSVFLDMSRMGPDTLAEYGLAHNPFTSLVVPRPIGWISTLNVSGVANLAPFSFFNAVSQNPPMVMFCANATHGDDVRRADQQHRQDVADAQDKLDHLSIISADLDMVAAGVEAIVPGVPEAWVTRGVVVLWVLLFSIGPCAFLRLGLVTIEEGCR